MFDEFLAKAASLRSAGVPFAIAVVIRSEGPASGKPGDKAIIQTDGQISGWVGGGCVQTIVVREALRTIDGGDAKLIRIAPDLTTEHGIVSHFMTCQSGGSMEIYVEPVLPQPRLIIFGRSPVAVALCRLGKAIGYSVAVSAPGPDRHLFHDADSILEPGDVGKINLSGEIFVVVSTQGENDETALEEALQTNVPHVAFVASAAKARKILQTLAARGLRADSLERVKAPAGIDIHAHAPEEIAISILAEVIMQRRGRKPRTIASSSPDADQTDPVCGMTVASGGYHSVFNGRTYYFCCAGCKKEFDARPEVHATAGIR